MYKASIAIFLATLLSNHVSSQFQPPTKPNLFSQICQSTYGNYTANSTYETNLKTVFSVLQKHASLESFYNTSTGSDTDTVYGQYYCRGDIDSTFCSQCIQQAAEHIFNNCTGFKSGVVWYDECTLRFRNESMFGIAEPPLSGTYGWLPKANTSDPAKFFSVLNDTMDSLVAKAAYGGGGSMFATGEGAVSAFETVYCLVQCSPDLNGTQCETCLVSGFSLIKSCCGQWSNAVFSFHPNCVMMYSKLGRFYLTTNAPTPPVTVSNPPPPIAPPPPPTKVQQTPPPPPNGGSTVVRSSASLKFGIFMTTALVFLMLVNSDLSCT